MNLIFLYVFKGRFLPKLEVFKLRNLRGELSTIRKNLPSDLVSIYIVFSRDLLRVVLTSFNFEIGLDSILLDENI